MRGWFDDLFIGLTNAGCPPDMLPYKAPGEKMACVPGPGYEVSKRTKLQPEKIRDWSGTQGPGILQTTKDYYFPPDDCPIFSKPGAAGCELNWNSIILAGVAIIGGSIVLRIVFKK